MTDDEEQREFDANAFRNFPYTVFREAARRHARRLMEERHE